jgi:hypothetical protein
MAKKRAKTISPIPAPWLASVISLLEEGDQAKINWTFRAKLDWQQFGLDYQAYEHCLKILKSPTLVGEKISGMVESDGQECDTWAFPCPHPFGLSTPLYAKIGLHQDQLQIDLFSLHIDLSGKLLADIKAYFKSKK